MEFIIFLKINSDDFSKKLCKDDEFTSCSQYFSLYPFTCLCIICPLSVSLHTLHAPLHPSVPLHTFLHPFVVSMDFLYPLYTFLCPLRSPSTPLFPLHTPPCSISLFVPLHVPLYYSPHLYPSVPYLNILISQGSPPLSIRLLGCSKLIYI